MQRDWFRVWVVGIVLAAAFAPAHAAGWRWVAPATSGSSLADVADGPRGFVAVGRHGAIVALDRDGTHWHAVASGTTANLSSIWRIPNGELWAGGDGGTLLHSRDGEAWAAATSGLTGDIRGLAGTGAALIAVTPDQIARSTDSGAHWTIGDAGGSPHAQVAIAARGELIAIVGGETRGEGEQVPLLEVSRDRGATWTYPAGTGGNTDSIAIGAGGELVVANQAVLRSTDRGATFAGVVSGGRLVPLLSAIDERDGGHELWAAGNDGMLLESLDAGATWLVRPRAVRERLARVAGHDRVRVAVGNNGAIVRSSDRGATWTAVAAPSAIQLRAIALAGTAIAVAGDQLAVSRDGGASFAVAEPAPREALHALWGTGATIYAAGEHGRVLRSDDGGATFATVAWLPEDDIVDAWGSGPDDMYLVGTVAVFHSAGHGSWTMQRRAADRLAGITGHDGMALIATVGGTVLRSTDHGASWTTTATGAHQLAAIALGADGRAIAVGDAGAWRSSADGAGPWTALAVHDPLRSIAIRGATVLAIGDTATVRSDDGGTTWRTLPRTASSQLAVAWTPQGAVISSQWAPLALAADGLDFAPIGTTQTRIAWRVWPASDGSLLLAGQTGSTGELSRMARDGTLTEIVPFDTGEYDAAWLRGNDLVVGGRSGAIAHAADGSPRVTVERTAPYGTITAIAGPSLAELFAIDDGGAVLARDAHGAWAERAPRGHAALYGLAVAADHSVWVCGQAGKMAVSRDRGASFRALATGYDSTLFGVWSDGTRVVAVGTNGTIIVSADGGATFRTQRDTAQGTLHAVASNGHALLVVGDRGSAAISRDGGATWTDAPAPTDDDLLAVTARPDGTFVVGPTSGALLGWSP